MNELKLNKEFMLFQTEDPSNYDVIKSPLAETEKFSFDEGNQISSDHDNRKQLNDLFVSQPVPTKDTEGQSFFDAIGESNDSIGIPVSQSLVNAPTLTTSSTTETVPPMEITKHPTTLALEEPNIPIEAENILQHHLHVSCLMISSSICADY